MASKSVQMLARTLPEVAPLLVTLSLAGCGIEDIGAKSLADTVRAGHLPRLRSLDLESNPFTPVARHSLRQACRERGVALSAYSEVENETLFE